ncbi:MAG: hypothetical protein MK000_09180, partial [Anaerolineales bacterium]|nr:hypothetical protein [Anaerolineales bacterium]
MTVIRRLRRMLLGIQKRDEQPMTYRSELFAELLAVAGKGEFQGERVLEIGPKDGLASMRLSSLEPSEL